MTKLILLCTITLTSCTALNEGSNDNRNMRFRVESECEQNGRISVEADGQNARAEIDQSVDLKR